MDQSAILEKKMHLQQSNCTRLCVVQFFCCRAIFSKSHSRPCDFPIKIMFFLVTIMSRCNVSIDLRVDISLNALNKLYCTVNGGLVWSYSWKVNGSHQYDGLFEENQIINYTTGTSQLIFTGSNVDLVGTFQCCITDGLGRTSSSCILQINGNILHSLRFK